jgi:carbon monoxide dehydrogenase subunit G
MKIRATYVVAAPPDRVYAALVDPVVLQRCIPGCESLTLVGEDRYEARVKIGVAGLKGAYTGHAELRDKQPPTAFTLAVDGKGSPGFVRATARVALAAADSGTGIECQADVQVGGLIAAVGSRLIEAAARKQMDEFFRRLEVEVKAEPT